MIVSLDQSYILGKDNTITSKALPRESRKCVNFAGTVNPLLPEFSKLFFLIALDNFHDDF
jgi:hypothetical protein